MIILIHVMANVIAGAYGHVWEHASTDEAMKVVMANAAAGSLVLALSYLLKVLRRVTIVIPATVVVMGAFLTLAGMGLVRFRSRLFSFRKTGGGSRILIVGTGRDAAVFARQVPDLTANGVAVGFVSEGHAARTSARRLAGLPVLGHLGRGRRPGAGARDQRSRRGRDAIRSEPARWWTVASTSMFGFASFPRPVMSWRTARRRSTSGTSRSRTSWLVLGWPPISRKSPGLLKGKRVLVTGAGGSIGGEIVGQVLGFEPAGVWALDRDETLLHDASIGWRGEAHIVLADVRDAEKTLAHFRADSPRCRLPCRRSQARPGTRGVSG